MAHQDFRAELESLINRYSKENGSNTPDFVLAHFLCTQLSLFDQAVCEREKFHGRPDPRKSATSMELPA